MSEIYISLQVLLLCHVRIDPCFTSSWQDLIDLRLFPAVSLSFTYSDWKRLPQQWSVPMDQRYGVWTGIHKDIFLPLARTIRPIKWDMLHIALLIYCKLEMVSFSHLFLTFDLVMNPHLYVAQFWTHPLPSAQSEDQLATAPTVVEESGPVFSLHERRKDEQARASQQQVGVCPL